RRKRSGATNFLPLRCNRMRKSGRSRSRHTQPHRLLKKSLLREILDGSHQPDAVLRGSDKRLDHLGGCVAPGHVFWPYSNAAALGIRKSHDNDSQSISVALRVLNLSALTDIFLQPYPKERKGTLPAMRRCTLKPDVKEWQTVTCFLDHEWRETLDRFSLLIPMS